MNALAPLYLDTARLGRMAADAQMAVQDFARLSGEEALPLYCEKFFQPRSVTQLQNEFVCKYPSLASWSGIFGLKAQLRNLLGTSQRTHCLITSRSRPLVKAAARLASLTCKRVLVADLCWTPYAKLVERQLGKAKLGVHFLPMRHSVFAERLSASDVTDWFASQFSWHECDGIILPAISHDGIHLPVDRILAVLRLIRPDLLAIVDASQAFGHVARQIGVGTADLIIGGTQKWMAAGMPLGLMFASDRMTSLLERVSIRDPLHQFLLAMEEGAHSTRGETVNVWPLFACHGVLQTLGTPAMVNGTALVQQRNKLLLLDAMCSETTLRPVALNRELSAGILLLDTSTCRASAFEIVRRLQLRGIIVSACSKNQLRVSLPKEPLDEDSIERLMRALRQTTSGTSSLPALPTALQASSDQVSGMGDCTVPA